MSYADLVRQALPMLRRPVELDEHKAAEAMRRGEAADRLLKDSDLSEAFADVNSVYMDVWAQSDPLDIETRERAWVATRLLHDLRALLVSRVRNGAAARKQIEQAAHGASAFN